MVSLREQGCIEPLAYILNKERQTASQFVCWLDTQAAENTPDALIKPYLIEHSSFDSATDLRAHNDHFEKIIDGINLSNFPELKHRYDVVIPFDQIRKGVNFKNINIEIKNALKNYDISKLSDETIRDEYVDNKEFHFYVWKTRHPNEPGVHPRRTTPTINPAQNFRSIFIKKANKLRDWEPCQAYRRLVLVECEDILLKYQELIQGLRDIQFNKPHYINEVWLCETTHHVGGVMRLYTNIYTGERYNFDSNLGTSYSKHSNVCYLT